MYCRKCGAENSESAKFCRKCGDPLGQGTENRKQDVHTGSHKSHKVLWIVLTILLLLAAILGAVYLGMRQKDARQNREYEGYLSDAAKYLEDADYERAEESYLEAIAIEPKRVEPYIGLADLYSEQDDYDKAEGYYYKAIDLKPDDAKPYLGLSNIYLEQGDYEKAEGILKNAKKAVKVETGKSEIQKQRDKVLDAQADYTWALEPTIEADNIYYVTENDMPQYTLNDMEKQHMSPYAVIQREDMFGMIDMTGNLVAGMDYTDIKMVENNIQMTRKEPQYFELLHRDWYVYGLFEDGSIGALFELELATSKGFLYYCGGLQQGLPGMELPVPEGSFPVKQSNVPYQGDFSGAYEWWRTLSGNYAICNGTELTTDFVYEECGSCSNGLMAACQNGKWGYVNENGEVVIPFEYDASWPEYERTDLNYENGTNKDYCYAASDGYVVLRKGDEWKLQDISGEIVIPPGIFEAIRPVYEGKCWVKKNGKWGVIQLAEDTPSQENPDEAVYEAFTDFLKTNYVGDYFACLYAGEDGAPILITTLNFSGEFEGRYSDVSFVKNNRYYPEVGYMINIYGYRDGEVYQIGDPAAQSTSAGPWYYYNNKLFGLGRRGGYYSVDFSSENYTRAIYEDDLQLYKNCSEIGLTKNDGNLVISEDSFKVDDNGPGDYMEYIIETYEQAS